MNNKTYIGELDTRITLVERVRAPSSTGGESFDENELNQVWAKVKDVSGSEEEDGKVFALNVRQYTIIYDPAIMLKNITDLYIIDEFNKRYNIYSFEVLGRKDWIELKCSKHE